MLLIYRSFIKACGAACANEREFLGICDYKRLNTVYETLKAKEHNPHIAGDMYLIGNVGINKIRTWQNSKGDLFQTIDDKEPENPESDLVEYLRIDILREFLWIKR